METGQSIYYDVHFLTQFRYKYVYVYLYLPITANQRTRRSIHNYNFPANVTVITVSKLRRSLSSLQMLKLKTIFFDHITIFKF